MDYHWYYRPETSPPVLRLPEQVTASDRLAVACTQTELPRSKQASLVRRWCEALPTFDHVRTLWLTTRVPQVLFDAACRMQNLEDMWIKWSGVNNIASLQGLPKLRYFHLGSSTGLRSIHPLAELPQLKWLGLENLKRIRELDPIGALTALEGLAIEGSIWSTWKVHSLGPLGALSGLRYLSLVNCRSEDGTLAPLFALRALEKLIVPAWWDREEVDEIRRRNPRLAV